MLKYLNFGIDKKPGISGIPDLQSLLVRLFQWWLGLVVARWSRSAKLLYAGPG